MLLKLRGTNFTKINHQGKDSKAVGKREKKMMSCLKEHIDDETVEGSHLFLSVSLYCGKFYGQRFLSGRQTNHKNKTQTDVALVL